MSDQTTGTEIAMDKLPIKLRLALEADAAFIFNSWLKSYRFGDAVRSCDNAVYFSEQHKLIESLLKRCQTVIACASNNPADIYGYICYERVEGILVLHYCYVKHSFRNMGIARELLTEAGHNRVQSAALYTHLTDPCKRAQVKLNLIYHPFILLNYQYTKSDEAAK